MYKLVISALRCATSAAMAQNVSTRGTNEKLCAPRLSILVSN
jgi:hypothetical protein